jgi:glutaminase
MSKHELQIVVEDLHERYHSLNDGEVATYIPELGKADVNIEAVYLWDGDRRVRT